MQWKYGLRPTNPISTANQYIFRGNRTSDFERGIVVLYTMPNPFLTNKSFPPALDFDGSKPTNYNGYTSYKQHTDNA